MVPELGGVVALLERLKPTCGFAGRCIYHRICFSAGPETTVAFPLRRALSQNFH